MSAADVEPALPAGARIVGRGPAPDPAVADERGLLRRRRRGGPAEGILLAPGAPRRSDGRVTPTSGGAS